jgi:hypothetical protein
MTTAQRRGYGAALVAGPLLLLVAQALDPTPDDADAAELLAAAGSDSGSWAASNLLVVGGAIVLVLGAFGLTPLLRGGGERLGRAGVCLLVAGLVCLAGWATTNLALAAVADAGGSVDVAEAIEESTSISVVEAVWIGGLLLGLVLIAVALLRAGSVPRWAPALILLFVALEGAFLLAGNGTVETIGFAALAAGFGTVGVRLLRAD